MSSGEWTLAGKPTTTADVQGLLQAHLSPEADLVLACLSQEGELDR